MADPKHNARLKRAASRFQCVLVLAAAGSGPAVAQSIDLGGVVGASAPETTARLLQIIVAISALSVAPSLIMMVTSFTRFVIVLSFLRSGLGLQSTPNNSVLIGLSLFMTAFVMAPTVDESWRDAIAPMSQNKMSIEEAIPRAAEPFRRFMMLNVREVDLNRLAALANHGESKNVEVDVRDYRVLIPAFMISELRRSFEIGFLVVLPFMVIDIIVAAIVMSMGMMMLSPQVFSLPLKLLFFVIIDGWGMLVSSLVRSFA